VVSNTTLDNNGSPGGGGGIQIAPAAGGNVEATLSEVKLGFNSTGIAFDSTSGPIVADLRDSVVASSPSNGIVSSAGVLTSLTIDGSNIVNNHGTGIRSSGGNSYVRIGGSTISVNGIGVSADKGGFLQSFKNNQIGGNATDGTPIGAFPGPGGTPFQ
jgi:hypothetical protein